MGRAPEGFEYRVRAGGEVQILHHGGMATVLRGSRARGFLDEVDHGDGQLLMARLTGNYRHGNERVASNHPRNRAAGERRS